MSETDGLVKVVVNLPNHWATGTEAMWAAPVSQDTVELRNVPFYAYGLNFLDVVRVTASSREGPVEVVAVVEPSGHRTLRVFFARGVPEGDRIDLLSSLVVHRASFERATSGYFAIDVEPDGEYDEVAAQLWRWESEGLLAYETCEPRIPGSFDDTPESPSNSA